MDRKVTEKKLQWMRTWLNGIHLGVRWVLCQKTSSFSSTKRINATSVDFWWCYHSKNDHSVVGNIDSDNNSSRQLDKLAAVFGCRWNSPTGTQILSAKCTFFVLIVLSVSPGVHLFSLQCRIHSKHRVCPFDAAKGKFGAALAAPSLKTVFVYQPNVSALSPAAPAPVLPLTLLH